MPLIILPPYMQSIALSLADPYYDKVVLLMHMDGTSGTSTFVDAKRKTIGTSTAVHSAVQSKFGGSSARFGNKTDLIQLPTSNDFTFDGDFTVEAWVYPDELFASMWCIIDARSSGATNATYVMGLQNDNGTYRPTIFATWSVNVTGQSTSVPLNQWSHVAFVRSGSTIKFFVNGVMDSYQPVVGTAEFTSGTNPILGSKDSGLAAYGTHGYMDEVRITKGVARYNGNFTAPTAAFGSKDTNWGGTLDTSSGPGGVTFSNGNLSAYIGGNSWIKGTQSYSTGTHYYEFTADMSTARFGPIVGAQTTSGSGYGTPFTGYWLKDRAATISKINPDGSIVDFAVTYGDQDTFGIEYDLDAKTACLYINKVRIPESLITSMPANNTWLPLFASPGGQYPVSITFKP